MVRPFVKRHPQNLDASPLLGANEHAYASLNSHVVSHATRTSVQPATSTTSASPAVAGENIQLSVRILSRASMPPPHGSQTPETTQQRTNKPGVQRTSVSAASLYQSVVDRSASGNRPQTQRSYLSTASSEMMMSPLVRTRPPSSWKRASQMSRDMADSQCVRFSVTIGARSSTVEDLAHVIESAYTTQRHLDATARMLCGGNTKDAGAADPLIICTALFKGSAPLLFSSNVGSVLQSGDTVTVYSSIGYEDSDDECGHGGIGDFAASRRGVGSGGGGGGISQMVGAYSDGSLGSSDTSRSGLSAQGEFLFVPLTTLPPIPGNLEQDGADIADVPSEPSMGSANTAVTAHRRSSAVFSTLGSASMRAVGELISQAPLKARFINVLIHPTLLRAFLEFCALPSELALESLLFVLDVERFRHVQPSMARLLANYIYLSYVAPNAPLRINISSQMRERIPWPFLPGWEYNPWVFDEILASVGFTLKKHTLLRFERSPVGLAALMASNGGDGVFDPAEYTKPLQFDLEFDPMVAIVTHFEPDIDVVIWVNELEIDRCGAQLAARLAQLTVDFREQLLMRVAAQFVDEHKAFSLCDGYFQLATHIKPLQKQRRIKKTRKIRNFFGDHPHEALLRQQLMAVVPPSSQKQAARAAAEVVARKKYSEAAHRRLAEGLLSRQGSVASSILAEQQILAMDSDSDIEKEHMHGWALQAMQKPVASKRGAAKHAGPLRERSWSDTDDDDDEEQEDGDDSNSDDGAQRINGWSSRGIGGRSRRGRTQAGRARMLRNNNQGPSSASLLRSNPGATSFKDQALDRALSMIGVSHADSQGSSSSSSSGSNSEGGGVGSSGGSDCGDSPATFPASIESAHVHFQGIDAYSMSGPGSCYDASQSFPSISRRSAAAAAAPLASTPALASAIYERKRRVDKLREFFGGADPSSLLAKKSSSMSSDHRGDVGADARGDTVRSTSTLNSLAGTASSSMDFEIEPSQSALTAEQRNLLVRRRRKLRALLGEDCVGHHLMPHVADTRIRASAAGTASALGLSLLPTPNSSSAAGSSLSSDTTDSSKTSGSSGLLPGQCMPAVDSDEDNGDGDGDGEQRVSGEQEKLRDAQIRQFAKIREVLGDSAPAPFLHDLRSRDAEVDAAAVPAIPAYLRCQAAAPASSASEEQRMRARWRRNKLMTVLGDVPTNVTTLYRSDPSGYPSSDQASDSEAASETSGVLVRPEDAPECDRDELALAKMAFGTGAMPVGADPRGKQGRRRRVKKLKSFFGQSLSSEAMLTQQQHFRHQQKQKESALAVLDTVAEEPETMSPPSLLASTDTGSSEQSYEFIPLRSPHPQQEPRPRQNEMRSPDWRLSLTRSQQALSLHNLGLAGVDSVERPFKAQFWVTDSPESQSSVVTAEKTSRRTSLMATLKARKASIIGSIKRATPSTVSVNTQGLANNNQSLGSVISLPSGSAGLQAAKAANAATRSPEVSSPASGKLGFIARQINKVATASPKLGAAAHPRSSPLVPPCRSSSIKPLSPLPAISPNNFQASFDRGIALREMVAVAEFISNGHSPTTEFPPRIRSAAAAAAAVATRAASNGPPNVRPLHQHVISSALLSGSGQMAQISTRSSRNAFDESSQHHPARQLGAKSVHWFDSPKPPGPGPIHAARHEQSLSARLISSDAIAANSIAFPQPSSAKSSMDSVTMSIVLRSPSTKRPALISPIISPKTAPSRASSSSVRPSRSGTQPIIPIAHPPTGSNASATARSPRGTLSHKASVTAVGGRRMARQSDYSYSGSNSNIVTIRARRSQSFAIRRRLEKATVGRKRSNTIGSGRQTDSRPDSQKDGGQHGADSFPRADKQSRRVRSMIIEAQMPVAVRFNRSRCVTVTPLRLELQRLMSRNRAARKPRRALLRPIAEHDVDGSAESAIKSHLERTRSQSIRMAANALCAQQPALLSAGPRQLASAHGTMQQKHLSRGPYKFSQQSHTAHMRNGGTKRLSCQTVSTSIHSNQKKTAHRLYRSRSCPSRINTTSVSRRSVPIQPAIMRYLASANPKRYNSLPVIKKMPGAISRSATMHMQGASSYASSYQRISLALLSRPSAASSSDTSRTFK
ncbi:hypothetical protein LPJ75_000405 [Coemansia sp. RSA 2598]|nr:hypothetical protein LPJ75_000405 [Coemansia sp. RSA 2598]